jgi:hypothetical protein
MIARTSRGWTGARDVAPYVACLGESGAEELGGTRYDVAVEKPART